MNEGDRNAMLCVVAGVAGLVAARALGRRIRAVDLCGKTVLITGGSRGLGLVMAREFGRDGARLALLARDPDELERAREDLKGRGIEVMDVPWLGQPVAALGRPCRSGSGRRIRGPIQFPSKVADGSDGPGGSRQQ